MPDIDHMRGSSISYKAVTMEGGTRTFGTATSTTDIYASEQYKSQLRTPSDSWYPSQTAAANTLTITETAPLREITVKGIDVFCAAAPVFGTPSLVITDEADNIYFKGNLVSGNNHFDFPNGGIICKKPSTSGSDAYGVFSVEILSPPAGTNTITLEGWKV